MQSPPPKEPSILSHYRPKGWAWVPKMNKAVFQLLYGKERPQAAERFLLMGWWGAVVKALLLVLYYVLLGLFLIVRLLFYSWSRFVVERWG